MTRQSQKNEEMHFAKKASELLAVEWDIEESPSEKDWPDLIVSSNGEKFGLEVRSIFKDEFESGSALRKKESFRNSCLKDLAEKYYEITDIPISLKINGDIGKEHIGNISEFLKTNVAGLEEKEQLNVVYKESGVKFYLQRLPNDFGQYSWWLNVSDYVGWVSKFKNEILENAISSKEKKIEKYRKNISDIRLLLVLNVVKNSGRAEIDEFLNELKSEFREMYIMMYPEKIYKVNCT